MLSKLLRMLTIEHAEQKEKTTVTTQNALEKAVKTKLDPDKDPWVLNELRKEAGRLKIYLRDYYNYNDSNLPEGLKLEDYAKALKGDYATVLRYVDEANSLIEDLETHERLCFSDAANTPNFSFIFAEWRAEKIAKEKAQEKESKDQQTATTTMNSPKSFIALSDDDFLVPEDPTLTVSPKSRIN